MNYLYLVAYSSLFFVEFLISFFLSAKELKKRKLFLLKAFLFFALSLLIVLLLPYFYSFAPENQQSYWLLVTVFLFYFLDSAAIVSLYETSIAYACFSESALGLTHFLARQIGSLIVISLNNAFSTINEYYNLLIELLSFGIVIAFTQRFFISRYQEKIDKIGLKDLLFFSIFFSVVSLAMEAIEIYIQVTTTSYIMMLIICEVFYGLMMFLICYSLLNQGESEDEIAVIKQIWVEDRKHYEIQKENMEMINIKVHDLKHRIEDIKTTGIVNEKIVNQLEESADIYQSIVQTGNEVLDVILSSVSLRCQKNKIVLTCMTDGKAIAFMDTQDIYSLFGNMLDNALDYESKITDPTKRFISLTIKAIDNKVFIHCENFFAEENRNSSDFLKTDKADKENHGFGTRSMGKIVDKYKGTIYLFLADKMFQVDCVIPISRGKNK